MLTDPEGNPIEAEDPRLPTPEQIAAAEAEGDQKTEAIARGGVALSPLVMLESQVQALVSLMVPPEGPVRLLYEARVQERRLVILDQVLKDLRDQAVGPALTIAQAVPKDLPRGFDVVR